MVLFSVVVAVVVVDLVVVVVVVVVLLLSLVNHSISCLLRYCEAGGCCFHCGYFEFCS